jgi:hypothetical protein
MEQTVKLEWITPNIWRGFHRCEWRASVSDGADYIIRECERSVLVKSFDPVRSGRTGVGTKPRPWRDATTKLLKTAVLRCVSNESQ